MSFQRLLPLGVLAATASATALPQFPKPYPKIARDVTPYTPLGCFVDSGERIFPHRVISSPDMTAAKCAENCEGYDYFGTQWSSECYCGSVAPTVPADPSECNMPCSGDPNEICGAGMRLTVYQFDKAPVSYPDVNGYEYQGCYTDNMSLRVLGGNTFGGANMTLESCAAFCSGYGYSIFGTENGNECFCGAFLDEDSVKVSEAECPMTCKGNENQKCGGPSRLSVYKLPNSNPPFVPAVVDEFRYESCWVDDVNDRALTSVDWRDDTMTIDKCAEHCKDYLYFGLEYGRECYCANEISSGQAVPEKECAMLCPGDATLFCGGGSRLTLYKREDCDEPEPSTTGTPEPTDTAVPTETAEPTAPVTTTATATATAEPTATPILDGTFESGLGSFTVVDSELNLDYEITDTLTHAGQGALLVKNKDENIGVLILETTVTVEPSATYAFSLYYWHTNPDAYTTLYLSAGGDVNNSDEEADLQQSPANQWLSQSVTFTTEADQTSIKLEIIVGAVGFSGNGSPEYSDDLYIDDVTLVRI